jgi:hypothetical protein
MRVRDGGGWAMRRLLVVAVVVVTVALPSVSVRASSNALESLPPSARGLVAGIESKEASLRAGMSGPSFVSRMRTVLAANGAAVPEVPALPAPSLADLAALRARRPNAAVPLAGLAAAVRQARGLIGDVPSSDVAEFLKNVLGDIGSWAPRQQATVAKTSPDPFKAPAPGPPAPPPMPAPMLITAPPASIAQAQVHDAAAALLIASALDRYLPALRASAGAPTHTAVSGCDVLDQSPYLCVGSEANNRYTQSEMLLVDFGGDDSYLNSAGGAPFQPTTGDPIMVSLNVDLGGNDRYELPSVPIAFTPDPALDATLPVVVGQGASVASGVGVLVDTGGDDVYRATTPAVSPSSPPSAAVAQGSTIEGVGALFDLGGSDRYSATAPDQPPTDGNLAVTGQGASEGLCAGSGAISESFALYGFGCSTQGVAVLVDTGGGDDRYVVDAGMAAMPPDEEGFALRAAIGQGAGGEGTAVLYDDGGADDFKVASAASAPGRTSYLHGGPMAASYGQGKNFIGMAALLEGDGNTRYSLRAASEGLALWTEAGGQGYSDFLGSTAILSDMGGDDRYTMDAPLNADLAIKADDGCGCPSAVVSVSGFGVTQRAGGQGAGFGANGLLHDRAGDDRYRMTADARLRVTLDDRLSAPSAPPALDVAGLTRTWFWGQGAVSAPSNGVVGALVDEGGNDSYTAVAADETTASASSAHAAGMPFVRAVAQPAASTLAQGGTQSVANSYGLLIDAGGSADRFLAQQSETVKTSPDPNGGFEPGGFWPSFQGDGLGGILLALGEHPSVLSGPSQTVCSPSSPGYRGFGTWSGCAQALGTDPDHQPVGPDNPGAGAAPNASGLKPLLEITADTPASASLDNSNDLDASVPRLPAGARLVDPRGVPIAGVPVHFDLQWTASAAPLPSWSNLWQADAVTGPDGIARADLPLFGTGKWVAALEGQLPPAVVGWRVLATYDGADGLYPRHAAKELTLA